MKIITMNEVPKEPYLSPLFTSQQVTSQPLILDSREMHVSIVNFGAGVRNKFHRHDGDQVLIIMAGKGFVATEKEKKIVKVGDLIWIPSNEKHWHGATEDSEFSHIVVMRAGGKLTQLEG